MSKISPPPLMGKPANSIAGAACGQFEKGWVLGKVSEEGASGSFTMGPLALAFIATKKSCLIFTRFFFLFSIYLFC